MNWKKRLSQLIKERNERSHKVFQLMMEVNKQTWEGARQNEWIAHAKKEVKREEAKRNRQSAKNAALQNARGKNRKRKTQKKNEG